MDEASFTYAPGVKESSHTNHLSVIDEEGNAVAVTTSVGAPFGSAVVAPGDEEEKARLRQERRWRPLGSSSEASATRNEPTVSSPPPRAPVRQAPCHRPSQCLKLADATRHQIASARLQWLATTSSGPVTWGFAALAGL